MKKSNISKIGGTGTTGAANEEPNTEVYDWRKEEVNNDDWEFQRRRENREENEIFNNNTRQVFENLRSEQANANRERLQAEKALKREKEQQEQFRKEAASKMNAATDFKFYNEQDILSTFYFYCTSSGSNKRDYTDVIFTLIEDAQKYYENVVVTGQAKEKMDDAISEYKVAEQLKDIVIKKIKSIISSLISRNPNSKTNNDTFDEVFRILHRSNINDEASLLNLYNKLNVFIQMLKELYLIQTGHAFINQETKKNIGNKEEQKKLSEIFNNLNEKYKPLTKKNIIRFAADKNLKAIEAFKDLKAIINSIDSEERKENNQRIDRESALEKLKLLKYEDLLLTEDEIYEKTNIIDDLISDFELTSKEIEKKGLKYFEDERLKLIDYFDNSFKRQPLLIQMIGERKERLLLKQSGGVKRLQVKLLQGSFWNNRKHSLYKEYGFEKYFLKAEKLRFSEALHLYNTIIKSLQKIFNNIASYLNLVKEVNEKIESLSLLKGKHKIAQSLAEYFGIENNIVATFMAILYPNTFFAKKQDLQQFIRSKTNDCKTIVKPEINLNKSIRNIDFVSQSNIKTILPPMSQLAIENVNRTEENTSNQGSYQLMSLSNVTNLAQKIENQKRNLQRVESERTQQLQKKLESNIKEEKKEALKELKNKIERAKKSDLKGMEKLHKAATKTFHNITSTYTLKNETIEKYTNLLQGLQSIIKLEKAKKNAISKVEKAKKKSKSKQSAGSPQLRAIQEKFNLFHANVSKYLQNKNGKAPTAAQVNREIAKRVQNL